MEAYRSRLYALSGTAADAASVAAWFCVLPGFKLQLRRGPSRECDAIEGRFLSAGAPFRVVARVEEAGACAGGGAQSWLRLSGRGGAWAFAFHRGSGAPVAAEVSAARALDRVSARLARARKPRRALEAALRACCAAPCDPSGALVARLRRLYGEAGAWVPPAKTKSCHGLLVALEPSEIDALRRKTKSRGDPPYQFCFDRERTAGFPTVPTFDVGGGRVPAAARERLADGVACVLKNASLLPAAERKWGGRAYLERELGAHRCQVLSVPADRREFAYVRSAARGPLDGAAGPYKSDKRVEPLPRGAVVPRFAYVTFAEYARGRAGECCRAPAPPSPL